jgi:hypothetical protein
MKSTRHNSGPLHLSPAGVQSFLQHGGLLMLYREHCPYCEEVHVPGRVGTTLAQVADRVHAEHPGTRFVCICDGPVHREALPPTVASHIDTYPTFVVKHGDVVTKYTGSRDEESLYQQAVAGATAKTASTGPPERVVDTGGRAVADHLRLPFVADVNELRRFLTRSTGAVLLYDDNATGITEFVRAWRTSEHASTLAAAALAVADKDSVYPSLHTKLREALGLRGYMLVATAGLEVHGVPATDAAAMLTAAIGVLSPPSPRDPS